jgi:hypothetical protein
MSKLSWTAMLVTMAVIVGCDSASKEKVPTTPPPAPTEAHQVLSNLKYIGARKDYASIASIMPAAPEVIYSQGAWFHFHAGQMGIALDEKELTDLKLLDVLNMGYISTQPLKMFPPTELKIDQFPPIDPKNPKFDPAYDLAKAKLVYIAGIYRLTKAIPTEMWPDLVIKENKPDAGNPKLRQLVVNYKDTVVMNMAALQKDDGKWALVYVQYKLWPEQLKKLVQAK